ncbi:hypothetical protein KEM55_007149, partial [Ascosphaera atra]
RALFDTVDTLLARTGDLQAEYLAALVSDEESGSTVNTPAPKPSFPRARCHPGQHQKEGEVQRAVGVRRVGAPHRVGVVLLVVVRARGLFALKSSPLHPHRPPLQPSREGSARVLHLRNSRSSSSKDSKGR